VHDCGGCWRYLRQHLRHHPRLYSDTCAQHHRPWQFYNAPIAAQVYGVLDKYALVEGKQ
jgi:hypothetical protein